MPSTTDRHAAPRPGPRRLGAAARLLALLICLATAGCATVRYHNRPRPEAPVENAHAELERELGLYSD